MCHWFDYSSILLHYMFDLENSRDCLLACLLLLLLLLNCLLYVDTDLHLYSSLQTHSESFFFLSFMAMSEKMHPEPSTQKRNLFNCFNCNIIWWIWCCHFRWVQTWTVDAKVTLCLIAAGNSWGICSYFIIFVHYTVEEVTEAVINLSVSLIWDYSQQALYLRFI